MDLQISLKAKIVAKSFKQKVDLEFFFFLYTFSPVSRITCITLLITDAIICDLKIHQMDINMIFLFYFIWRLRRRNLLDQTKGFIELGQEKKVCNVIREVYGLKKAPKQ